MTLNNHDIHLQGDATCPECHERRSKCECLDEEVMEEQANKWEEEE